MASVVKTEDSVEYWIYSPSADAGLNELLSFILSLSRNYIWHNECFQLVERDFPCRHFYGSTYYGENPDDEWFIVHLLLQITIQFPDVVVRVLDYDGDFLLIEAEKFLPRWITPEKIENRIFLHNGAVHIIPRQKDAPTFNLPETITSPQQGVEIVRKLPQLTFADAPLQLCIENKLKTIVDNAKTNLHNAYCFLPAKLAVVLKERPNLISSAVQAFYCRDPKDLKVCRQSKIFPHDNLVLRRVQFTRHLYAMICGQKFLPDRRSPWKFPSIDDPSYKWHSLGFKLTAGFEILCSRVTNLDENNATTTIVLDNDQNWTKFFDNLEKNGYFQNEYKFSQRYNELLAKAKNFYLDQIQNSSKEHNYGAIVMSILTSTSCDVDSLKNESSTLPPEDDDSWLNVTPEMLDSIFNRAEIENSSLHSGANGYCKDVKSKTSATDSNCCSPKETIKQKVTSFVKSQGSLEGANLPADSATNGHSRFGGPPFESSLRHMLDLQIPESSSDSSDMDESYGEESNDDEEINVEDMFEMQKSFDAMKSYMKQMDDELSNSAVAKSLPLKKPTSTIAEPHQKNKSPGANSIDLEDDDFTPVDINKSVVKNMLQSYYSEAGNSGPASALLHSLNVLPSKMRQATLDSDDDEDDM